MRLRHSSSEFAANNTYSNNKGLSMLDKPLSFICVVLVVTTLRASSPYAVDAMYCVATEAGCETCLLATHHQRSNSSGDAYHPENVPHIAVCGHKDSHPYRTSPTTVS